MDPTPRELRGGGFALIVFGVVGAPALFVFGYAIGRGPGIGLCVIAVVFGAMCIVRGIRSLVAARRVGAPPLDDPRWSDEPSPPQVAGKTCAMCTRRIAIATAGTTCNECGEPVHTSCLTQHALAHLPAGPFRGG